MNTLGAATNRAYWYDRNGQHRVMELPCDTITYPRVLNQIGRGTFTVPASSVVPGLEKLASWGHTVVVYRGLERVWEGPVRRVTRNPRTGDLTIEASDVVGWLEKREILVKRKRTGVSVTGEMLWTVNQAFSGDDPNVAQYVTVLGGGSFPGPNIDRDIAPHADTHAGDLGSLTGQGAGFTVLGRRILIWADDYRVGRLLPLVPEDHLLADVTVTEDGDNAVTGVYAVDDDGHVGYYGGPSGAGEDPFYGVLDGRISVGGSHKPDALRRMAGQAFRRGFPAPVTVDVPGDAQLRADAPFGFGDLVPGVVWPVQTTSVSGVRVDATLVLTGVKVSQDATGEKVTVTVGTLNDAA